MTSISELPVNYQERTGIRYDIKVDGLLGGHSGAEIDKIRANATLLMARFLHEFREFGEFGLICLKRRSKKDNANSRVRPEASVLTGQEDGERLVSYAAEFTQMLRKEYTGTMKESQVTAVCQGRRPNRYFIP